MADVAAERNNAAVLQLLREVGVLSRAECDAKRDVLLAAVQAEDAEAVVGSASDVRVHLLSASRLGPRLVGEAATVLAPGSASSTVTDGVLDVRFEGSFATVRVEASTTASSSSNSSSSVLVVPLLWAMHPSDGTG